MNTSDHWTRFASNDTTTAVAASLTHTETYHLII